MADSAFMTQYRDEYIAGFEQRQTLIRDLVTTEFENKGNQAVFLGADSNGDEATTRGNNGLIPAKFDNLNQYTATLVEWHDLRKRTNFNIFASQGDGRRIMQENSLAVMNRKIDQDIIAELNTATQNTGASATGSLALVMKAIAILGNNNVPMDGMINGLMTPAMYAYLMQQPAFTSRDYVREGRLEGQMENFRWGGVNWLVHPNLPGKGTNAEKVFIFHKSAIGHAVDTEGLKTAVGYDEEQDYSFARATCYMGSKLLQNSGVVVINHDGSALVSA